MDADLEALRSGAAEIVPADGLEQKLALGRPLRVKFGIDPSRPDLTLGHTVVLRKLQRFIDQGHTAVLIVGDFTSRVGDPSGRSETRPMLTAAEADANAETYLQQAGLALDVERAEVHRNAEWLDALGAAEMIRLTSVATVAQMLEREDFRARYRDGRPISVVELLYPLLQGYDSVAVQADIELGGTDQTFNLLMGREIQRAYGQEPQAVLTMPLLEGLDGVRKMSKSLDNYVALTDPPEDMFGKLMSIPDGLIAKYELLCAGVEPDEYRRIEAGLADGTIHPNDEKRRMARTIVDLYHGAGAGEQAEAAFDRVFKRHEAPAEIPDVLVPASLFEQRDGGWAVAVPALLEAMALVSSRSEGRRMLGQGAVKLDGNKHAAEDVHITGTPPGQLGGSVWQVGRRRFARLAGITPQPR
jgi:tyrosyl-tRNA synthetase